MIDLKAPKSNPIRDSKNRIKLGVFGINGNGAAFTFHPDRFKCTWDANVRLAQKPKGLASRVLSLRRTGNRLEGTITTAAT